MLLLSICTAALASALAAALLFAVWWADRAESGSIRRRDLGIALVYATVALGLSGLLAAGGALRDFSALPPPFLRLFVPLSIVTGALALSPFGARLVKTLPLWGLVGFQTFRVLVELLLWRLHHSGVVPVQMTFEGDNFDLLTGLSAAVVAWLLARGRTSARVVWVWNALGLGLLLNVVAIAMLSMPTPLRVFASQNTIVAELPFVWIPCVMVQAALFGHILVFRSLRVAAHS
jgi:hypothetical protein